MTPAKCFPSCSSLLIIFCFYDPNISVIIHSRFCFTFASNYCIIFFSLPTSKNCCIFSLKLLLQVRYFYSANYYFMLPNIFDRFSFVFLALSLFHNLQLFTQTLLLHICCFSLHQKVTKYYAQNSNAF